MSWGANHVPQAPRRDPTVAAFKRADAAERRRRRDTLELLLREAKGFSMVADRMNLPSKPAIDRCAGRLQRLLRSLDAADASRDRDNARKAIDAYALEARRLLGHAREEFDRGGKPTQIVRRIRDLDIAKRSAWRPATWKGGERTIRPLFTAEFPRNAQPTDFFATRHDPSTKPAVKQQASINSEGLAGDTRKYQDVFDLAGGAYGGHKSKSAFVTTSTVALQGGAMLEVEAFDNKAIRKLTLIKSPEQKPHQRGTIRKRLPSEDGTASAKSLDANTRKAFEDLEARQARRMTGQRGNKVSLLKDDGWRW